jgi:hypothetical protein
MCKTDRDIDAAKRRRIERDRGSLNAIDAAKVFMIEDGRTGIGETRGPELVFWSVD